MLGFSLCLRLSLHAAQIPHVQRGHGDKILRKGKFRATSNIHIHTECQFILLRNRQLSMGQNIHFGIRIVVISPTGADDQ